MFTALTYNNAYIALCYSLFQALGNSDQVIFVEFRTKILKFKSPVIGLPSQGFKKLVRIPFPATAIRPFPDSLNVFASDITNLHHFEIRVGRHNHRPMLLTDFCAVSYFDTTNCTLIGIGYSLLTQKQAIIIW